MMEATAEVLRGMMIRFVNCIRKRIRSPDTGGFFNSFGPSSERRCAAVAFDMSAARFVPRFSARRSRSMVGISSWNSKVVVVPMLGPEPSPNFFTPRTFFSSSALLSLGLCGGMSPRTT